MVVVIKEHTLSLFDKGIREDGRKLDEYRKDIKIEKDISPKSSEGSARVTIGDTVVVAGVKMALGEPFPDTPDEGAFMVNMELLPLASPDFESGPPSIDSIELSRIIDRVIRESHYLDLKKLCIKKGEKVWMVFIDIYPVNDSGNLYDAAYLAALTALRAARFPKLAKDTVDYNVHTKEGLPLEKNFPLSCTVMKMKDYLFVDATEKENEIIDARLTVGVMHNDKMCALQKGGDMGVTIEEVGRMVDLAIQKTKELRKLIK